MTIRVQNGIYLLGRVMAGKMKTNEAGSMVIKVWTGLAERFPGVVVDEFMVMPNHFHGIIIIKDAQGDDEGRGFQGDKGEYKIRPCGACREGLYNDGDSEVISNFCIHLPAAHSPKPPATSWPHGTADGSLGRIIQAFKSITTHEYIIGVKEKAWPPFRGKLWQRNYHDWIIRDEAVLNRVRRYIVTNPEQWKMDR